MRFVRAGVLSVITTVAVAAQTPNPAFHASVNLVQVDAVVTDSKGQHVSGLKAEDFEILEDGKPQKIASFSWARVRPTLRKDRLYPYRSRPSGKK
jgi:hypothetical protein